MDNVDEIDDYSLESGPGSSSQLRVRVGMMGGQKSNLLRIVEKPISEGLRQSRLTKGITVSLERGFATLSGHTLEETAFCGGPILPMNW